MEFKLGARQEKFEETSYKNVDGWVFIAHSHRDLVWW